MSMKLRLCIPPIVLCILDQSITLLGQHSQYWKGDYQTAMEGCPPFHWLLQQHPLAFEAGIAVWLALFRRSTIVSSVVGNGNLDCHCYWAHLGYIHLASSPFWPGLLALHRFVLLCPVS